MNREEVQLLGFEIVAYAGDARSKLLEALNAANEGDFDKAEQLTEEANECIANAHKAQTNLLAQEAQGDDIAFSITMIHGQDHLMTTLLLKDLMKHLIELYKKELTPMNKLIAWIEKGKPFFEKISRNIYLRAIRDGFIAAIPIILFSSIFILITYVPNVFGFTWSKTMEGILMKPYNYTMGIVGLIVAGTTAKSLTDSYNRKLDKTNQINFISTMMAAMSGFLFLAADPIKRWILSAFMGTKGLLTAFISAFITVIVYNFFIKRNITIKMPKEVPPNISQVFKDIFPLSAVIIIIYALDLLSRTFIHTNVANAVLKIFEPLFTAADGWIGVTLIFGAFAFFWFVGIHGPSIVEPAIAAITYANLETNLNLIQAGEHADKIITPGTQMFVATMGVPVLH